MTHTITTLVWLVFLVRSSVTKRNFAEKRRGKRIAWFPALHTHNSWTHTHTCSHTHAHTKRKRIQDQYLNIAFQACTKRNFLLKRLVCDNANYSCSKMLVSLCTKEAPQKHLHAVPAGYCSIFWGTTLSIQRNWCRPFHFKIPFGMRPTTTKKNVFQKLPRQNRSKTMFLNLRGCKARLSLEWCFTKKDSLERRTWGDEILGHVTDM